MGKTVISYKLERVSCLLIMVLSIFEVEELFVFDNITHR
ncbi:hypothetical protein Krodi_2319 [Dokdonia sp. 4H-3-7-5]|nr:hypothetical protein Krodi_2319 [Dokdonia sp. 4H-3-7-5]